MTSDFLEFNGLVTQILFMYTLIQHSHTQLTVIAYSQNEPCIMLSK